MFVCIGAGGVCAGIRLDCKGGRICMTTSKRICAWIILGAFTVFLPALSFGYYKLYLSLANFVSLYLPGVYHAIHSLFLFLETYEVLETGLSGLILTGLLYCVLLYLISFTNQLCPSVSGRRYQATAWIASFMFMCGLGYVGWNLLAGTINWRELFGRDSNWRIIVVTMVNQMFYAAWMEEICKKSGNCEIPYRHREFTAFASITSKETDWFLVPPLDSYDNPGIRVDKFTEQPLIKFYGFAEGWPVSDGGKNQPRVIDKQRLYYMLNQVKANMPRFSESDGNWALFCHTANGRIICTGACAVLVNFQLETMILYYKDLRNLPEGRHGVMFRYSDIMGRSLAIGTAVDKK